MTQFSDIKRVWVFNEASLEAAQFTEPGKVAMRDEDALPFAGLAALREHLAGKDEG